MKIIEVAKTETDWSVLYSDGQTFGSVTFPLPDRPTDGAIISAILSAVHPAPQVKAVSRVLKDTIIMRIAEIGGDEKIVALDDVLLSQSRAAQIKWRDSSWFSSDNPQVSALIAAIGMDPAVILSSDPLAP